MEGPKLVGLVHAKEEGPAAAAEAEIAQQTVRIWLNRSSFAAVVAQFDSLSLFPFLLCVPFLPATAKAAFHSSALCNFDGNSRRGRERKN
jgi:hypothetical protein